MKIMHTPYSNLHHYAGLIIPTPQFCALITSQTLVWSDLLFEDICV